MMIVKLGFGSTVSSATIIIVLFWIMTMTNHSNLSIAQLRCGEECTVAEICQQSSHYMSACMRAHDCCEWLGSIGCRARVQCEEIKIPCPCTYKCPRSFRQRRQQRRLGEGEEETRTTTTTKAGGPKCYPHDKCKTNIDCGGIQSPKICCRNECGGHECIDGEPSKLVCPTPFGIVGSTCRDYCNSNDSCRNGQICCLTDLCTFKCVYGVTPYTVLVCPLDDDHNNLLSSSSSSFPSSCDYMCNSHDDCNGENKLCCSGRDCGTQCVDGIYPIP